MSQGSHCPHVVWRDSVLFLLFLFTGLAWAGLCPADVDGNGRVDRADLRETLANWNLSCAPCPADVNGDNRVNILDSVWVQQQQGSLCGAVITAQLAGRELGERPYFEHVAAFNDGELIQVGLETWRFPWLMGETADLYIVEAKTHDQWQADPSLTDATADGAQTILFQHGSITENIFTLSGSDELSSEAGLGLGRPYDVIIDLNQNGVLDGNDFIDGLEDEASLAAKTHGCYVVHDLTQPGPLAVSETFYSALPNTVTAGYESQHIFYPTDIANMGRLPLIIVSHGNGHNYLWYSHIGNHMASYGYIVMSHANNTGPGVITASTTTLQHTDAFLNQHHLIDGGVLVSHVDASRMVWLGHSRGGEGVAIAVDRIVEGTWTPVNYSLEDLALVSSIAPVDFQGPTMSTPHDVNYHLWTGGADADVNGCANCNLCQTFHLHERASAWRQSISLHGVGHGDFHDGTGGPVATGPCLVGRENTHLIMKGHFLPLVKHYVEGNVPARDFLWRQWEGFKPIGAPTDPCVTVDLMYRDWDQSYVAVDDYQTMTSVEESSSGGTAVFSGAALVEGRLDDNNSNFTTDPSDPMNGITLAGVGDDGRGVVLEYAEDAWYELSLVPALQDLTSFSYLQFRAAQTPRHGRTIAALEDLTFTVTLRDGWGVSSSINIGAYGGGVEEPYQRTSCGSGVGWAAEFETIRMRIQDFLKGGVYLDLTQIEAVRFDLGPSHGSAEGRIALDDVAFSKNLTPPPAGALRIALTQAPPDLLAPGEDLDLTVHISGVIEDMVPGTGFLHYRLSKGPYQETPLTALGDDLYHAVLPGAVCGDEPEFYFTAEGSVTGAAALPVNGPGTVFSAEVGSLNILFSENMDADPGWTSEGLWAWGQSLGAGGANGNPDPISGATGQFVYGYNLMGDYENNLSETHLTTPPLDFSEAATVILEFQRWLGVEDSFYDHAYLLTSTDGIIWDIIWENTVEVTDAAWNTVTYNLSQLAAGQPQFFVRWTMGGTDGSLTYCGWNIDDVVFYAVTCP